MSGVITCPDCFGKGLVRGRWCQRCAGEGYIEAPATCPSCGHAHGVTPGTACAHRHGVPGFPSTYTACGCTGPEGEK